MLRYYLKIWCEAKVFLQLLTVYSPKFETGGEFWPIVHNSTIFSLVLMHIIAVGIFGLKKVPLASGFIFPLPIITLLFNSYCRKRFLPIFKSYSAEVHWHTLMTDLNFNALNEQVRNVAICSCKSFSIFFPSLFNKWSSQLSVLHSFTKWHKKLLNYFFC